MNVRPTISRSDIKDLFNDLVRAVGGIEAAGAYLGITHQRVSQLQTPTCADMPTLSHVVTLEAVVGQDIVTGALSRAATGEIATGDPERELGDVHIAGANVLKLHRANAPLKTKRAAALEMVAEANDVADSYGALAG